MIHITTTFQSIDFNYIYLYMGDNIDKKSTDWKVIKLLN